MTRALVLSGETPSAVATVRALHGRGFEVAVLAEHFFSPAAASWRCARALRCGAWRSGDLVDLVLASDADVVVPATESDLLRLGPVRDAVERVARVVAPPPDVLERALDKFETGRLARELGDPRVTAPVEVRLERFERVQDLDPSDFPVVAKPRRSRTLLPDGTVWGGSAAFCSDRFELRDAHGHFGEGGQETLVQRQVHGAALLVSLLLHDDGAPAQVFVHRRLRQALPEGGPSACAVSHAPSPAIVEPSVALARALGLVGVPAQFEYVVPESGPAVLLDVNPRPWGTLALAVDAGVDFFGTAARHALGAELPRTPPAYEVGLVRHYLPFELRRLFALTFRDVPAGYAGPVPEGGVGAWLSWAHAPGGGLVFRLDDPLAGFADAVNVARRALLRG